MTAKSLTTTLGAICELRRGASPRPIADPRWFSASGPGWVRISDLGRNGKYLRWTEQYLSNDGAARSVRVARGDVIMSIAATIGRSAIVEMDACIHDGFVVFSRPLPVVRPEFLYYLLELLGPRFGSVGQHGSQANINTGIIENWPVCLPALAAQERMLGVLRSADYLLERGNELVQATRRFKRALLQQLLTGKRRFREFSRSKLRLAALGDVSHNASQRNNGRLGVERVMGVLKHEGLVPMRERSIGGDLTRYKVVAPGAFAYNPMRINIGSIAYSWHEREVLVSPDYEVFECDPKRLDARYLDHVRRSEPWRAFMKRAGSGSVRLRIYFEDLAQFVLPLPSIEEQRRIAVLLDELDHELTLLTRQLAALRKLKRGLMQKLLTGELEVPVDHKKGKREVLA